MRLEDKVCLITGTAKGAKLFASPGARVWTSDVLNDSGESLAAETGGN